MKNKNSIEEDKNILQKNRIFLTLGSKKKLNEMAFNLFKNLRIADNLGVDHIICEGIEEKGIGIGIMNRLKKSSSNNIILLFEFSNTFMYSLKSVKSLLI